MKKVEKTCVWLCLVSFFLGVLHFRLSLIFQPSQRRQLMLKLSQGNSSLRSRCDIFCYCINDWDLYGFVICGADMYTIDIEDKKLLTIQNSHPTSALPAGLILGVKNPHSLEDGCL